MNLTPSQRTAMHLADIRKRFGEACALAHSAPSARCPECGAVAGYVHPRTCTHPDAHPELGTERD